MNTKKAKVTMILEMEKTAFEELISKEEPEAIIKFKKENVYYEEPEIQSINNIQIKELDDNNIINGMEKREFDNYTVGEVIDILSTFPKNYEFLCCGESDYAIWVDHNSGMISIDKADWINEQMEEIIKNEENSNA